MVLIGKGSQDCDRGVLAYCYLPPHRSKNIFENPRQKMLVPDTDLTPAPADSNSSQNRNDTQGDKFIDSQPSGISL